MINIETNPSSNSDSSDEEINKVEKWKRNNKKKKYKRTYKYRVQRNKNGTFKSGKRKKINLVNYINETGKQIITLPEFLIEINGHKIKAEIDSGATTSVMSTRTLQKIGLNPNEPSKAKLTSFNEKEANSIGKLNTNLTIDEIKIPITFEIFDQNKHKCLIGIDWLKENNGKLDIEKEEISLRNNNQKCKIPIVIYRTVEQQDSETEYETSTNDEWSPGEDNNDSD